MKKIISPPLMLIFSIIILTGVFFPGCNSDTASDGGITADDVIGTWIKVWEGDPYQYSEGHFADTLIFDIGESDLEAVFYLTTQQVGGFKGTWSVADDEIVVSVTHTWNEEWDFYGDEPSMPTWEVPDESNEYRFPASPGSNSLTIIAPDETNIAMEKITFSRPEVLSNPPGGNRWKETGESDYFLFFLDTDDEVNHHYEWPPQYGEGTWDASGTDTGYIRTNITFLRDEGEGVVEYFDLNWGFLNPYTITSEGENVYLNLGLYIDAEIIYSQFEPYVITPQ